MFCTEKQLFWELIGDVGGNLCSFVIGYFCANAMLVIFRPESLIYIPYGMIDRMALVSYPGLTWMDGIEHGFRLMQRGPE